MRAAPPGFASPASSSATASNTPPWLGQSWKAKCWPHAVIPSPRSAGGIPAAPARTASSDAAGGAEAGKRDARITAWPAANSRDACQVPGGAASHYRPGRHGGRLKPIGKPSGLLVWRLEGQELYLVAGGTDDRIEEASGRDLIPAETNIQFTVVFLAGQLAASPARAGPAATVPSAPPALPPDRRATSAGTDAEDMDGMDDGLPKPGGSAGAARGKPPPRSEFIGKVFSSI